ncbi:ankyrin repeat domain-containing protein [Aquibacillus sediminis]|uniref:ankyrin repeat domain-containing protein n=1 Tax=Aquibacillus sediminis TaxID=2574734 RepID=UPI00110836A7|nr:ankyrin repeat domain-containing protein [Aquibacillus sediminis]
MTKTFFNLVSEGNEQEIKDLLVHGQQADIKDKNGRTPLMYAAYFNHIRIIEMLVEYAPHNLDVTDRYGNTALMLASYRDNADSVKLLLVFGANYSIRNEDGLRAYEIANKYKCNCEIILRNRYIEGNIQNWQLSAAYSGDLNILKKIPHSNLCQLDIIVSAAHSDNREIMEWTFKKGINNFNQIHRAFIRLIINKNNELISFIADFIDIEEHINYTHNYSFNELAVMNLQMQQDLTPLKACVQYGNEHILRKILSYLPNINMQSGYYKQTPLMLACKLGKLKTVEILLNAGSNLVVEDKDNKRAINYAIENGYVEITRLLLERGSEIGETIADIKSLIEIFVNDNTKMLELLLEYGLNPNKDFNDRYLPFGMEYSFIRNIKFRSLLSFTAVTLSCNCMRLLLGSGADTNLGYPYTALSSLVSARNNDFPLHINLNRNLTKFRNECLKLLLEYNGDVNVITTNGEHIIIHAFENFIPSTINLLLKYSKCLDVNIDHPTVLNYLNEKHNLDSRIISTSTIELVTKLYNLNLITRQILTKYQTSYDRSCKILSGRNTVCFSCYKPISEVENKKCNKCNWIICECGSCGCNYIG